MNKLTKVAATVVTASTLVMGPAAAACHEPSPPKRAHWMKTPCGKHDDRGVNCFWNAKEQGDHRGHSFYVREFPGRANMICVMFVGRKYAKNHDYCVSR